MANVGEAKLSSEAKRKKKERIRKKVSDN